MKHFGTFPVGVAGMLSVSAGRVNTQIANVPFFSGADRRANVAAPRIETLYSLLRMEDATSLAGLKLVYAKPDGDGKTSRRIVVTDGNGKARVRGPAPSLVHYQVEGKGFTSLTSDTPLEALPEFPVVETANAISHTVDARRELLNGTTPLALGRIPCINPRQIVVLTGEAQSTE